MPLQGAQIHVGAALDPGDGGLLHAQFLGQFGLRTPAHLAQLREGQFFGGQLVGQRWDRLLGAPPAVGLSGPWN